jgi:VWFA-related protein
MPRSLLLLVFVLASLSCRSFAQSNNPEASGVTLHANTRLVVVDVVVTDSHKNPVKNLKSSDFTLLEDNLLQKIQHFDEHTGTVVNARPEAASALPPGIFSNYSAAPAGSSINVLLLDMLNTPAIDQIYVKDQIRKFLKTVKPGAPIAIFGLTTRLSLLQAFTADPELLRNAVNKRDTSFSALLSSPTTGAPAQSMVDDATAFEAAVSRTTFGAGAPVPQEVTALQQAGTLSTGNLDLLRDRYTLDAINQLGRYLAGMPGRKNLMWFSGSFPIDITATDAADQFHNSYETLEEEFRETVNILTRAQVAVYPIDARGAVVSNVGDVSQDDKGRYNVSDPNVNPMNFANDQTKFHQRLMNENATMVRMAEQTGGKAYLNDNDLAGAVTQAIDTGSNYYTLAYTPSDPHWNGNYRRIVVKLHQGGVTLAYRRGYYADDPNSPSKKGRDITAAQVASKQANNPMRLAMMYGAPDLNEIALKVRVLPVDEKPAEKLSQGNTLPAGSRMKGPYRSYAVDFAASPREIQFTQAADGIYHSYLQFATYVYDRDGHLLNRNEELVRANLAPPAYARVLAAGVPFHQEISVPVKGNYYLRIGIRDLGNTNVGAVEVPVETIKDLQPMAPTDGNSAARAPTK